MALIFDPIETPTVAIVGTEDRFPVRRIFCVGRNYVDHAFEMGGDPDREPPFFFTKPADSLVPDGSTVPFPVGTDNLHHEAELVVAIGKDGADIPVTQALEHVWGYAAGNDLTRRDLQNEAKQARRPWDMSKGFDRSAVVGDIRSAQDIGHPERGALRLDVNGDIRQNGDLSQQIWKVPEIVSYLSGLVTIKAGDLIMTGTPAGVGPLVPGDVCTVEIEGIGRASFRIEPTSR